MMELDPEILVTRQATPASSEVCVCVCLLPRHGGASSSLLNPKVLKRLAKHSAALPGLLSDPGPASFLVSHPHRHP